MQKLSAEKFHFELSLSCLTRSPRRRARAATAARVAQESAGGDLFVELVGEEMDRIRDRQPDRLRGSEIEDQVELRGLFHR